MSHSSTAEGFASLRIADWRQFEAISLDFHPRLTVLTGANGAGKTTVLNLLGQHFQWMTQYLGIPRGKSSRLPWDAGRSDDSIQDGSLGTLRYISGYTAKVSIYADGPVHHVQIVGQQLVPGLYLSSHRSLSAYQRLQTIPAEFSATEQIFSSYFEEIFKRYLGQSYTTRTPMVLMKEALIAAAMYGYGGPAVEPNQDARMVWEGFQDVMSKVLPRSLGFLRLIVRAPEVVVQTTRGEFLIDAVSGGLSSLIELSWQIFLRSRETAWFTVCMDEPENHLHPEMQRSIIPSLLDAFPNISLVVATHSPFIVTSVMDSHVYVLDYVGERVESRLLDTANKAASSDETLRRVLGLETTAPKWVENRLQAILDEYAGIDVLTAEHLRRLQSQLRQAGLSNQFPAAVDAITTGLD